MSNNSEADHVYLPVLINRKKQEGNDTFQQLLETHSDRIVRDQFASQKKELFKIQNPKKRLSQNELDVLFDDWKADKEVDHEGIWVYYPWSNILIHVLEKNEFVALRTSRNQHKISKKEQEELGTKKLGIIGLSVGSAVALSIATERSCGKLKLADFDVIELSNLNRLKTGLQNIGLNKCIVTAREIAEIDPFIEVECFTDGITENNIQAFMTGGGKLDILIDECDDIEVKILCRTLGKELQIPVVMETSDRGMLDVERYDLENNRSIFHGLLADLPAEKLRQISPQDRLPMVMRIVDVMQSSYRAKLSLLEIGQTITTWPQLASAVSLGGAVVADVCRRILLGQFTASGRFYVDLEQIIAEPAANEPDPVASRADTFDMDRALRIVDSLPRPDMAEDPGEENIRKMVEAGSMAPSSGNSQPWKWLYKNQQLFLFHDTSKSTSFHNFNDSASHIALGASYENVVLKASELSWHIASVFYPLPEVPDLMASISFHLAETQSDDNSYDAGLARYISSRTTNRHQLPSLPIDEKDFVILKDTAESVPGAKLDFITHADDIAQMAGLIAETDLIGMLNKQGHSDFFEKSIQWSPADHLHNGISPGALGMIPPQLAALSMARDKKIAQTLKQIGGGNNLVENTRAAIAAAPCLALLSLPKEISNKFFVGGVAVQRLWLRAEQLGYALHPFNSPLSLFSRLETGEGLDQSEIEKLLHLRKIFRSITNLDEKLDEIFLFKIARVEGPAVRTKRFPLNEILFMVNNEI